MVDKMGRLSFEKKMEIYLSPHFPILMQPYSDKKKSLPPFTFNSFLPNKFDELSFFCIF